MSIRIGIYLFDDIEVLDFAGPFEVFTTASRVHGRTHPQATPPFEVCTIGHDSTPVVTRAGLRVWPEYGFTTHPLLDLLLVPGGVVDAELADADVVAWVKNTAQHARWVASVCTGAFLLAEAGLLDGRVATTHWEDAADLAARYPAVTVREGPRWVDGDTVITSAGIAAGIDMSLHLVARLAGEALAKATARQMDVPWRPEPG